MTSHGRSSRLLLKSSLLSLTFLTLCCCLTAKSHGSGYGVFTQGASGLGQGNAVVAHPTGPSSLYFNPALLNDVPGTQLEVGTTVIYADREINLDSGGSESETKWNFPSTFYLTHEINGQLTAGIGVFFPFGLSNEWDDDYEGRYIATEGELFTTNINPVISWRVNDNIALAAGVSAVYLDATLENKINQSALLGPTNDISQKLEGDDWGLGYNLGLLIKMTDKLTFGAAYRSEVNLKVEDADIEFKGVNPILAAQFPDTKGDAEIDLPQQVVAGIAAQLTENLVMEVGVRWEDWNSTKELKVELETPVFTQSEQIVPRDWQSTWTYNIGGQYQFTETVALNAGYLYGQNAVPGSTFEPLIPDSDAHLFCLGAEVDYGQWTVSGAFAYEYHDRRAKNNLIADPIGSLAAGMPVNTANGDYDTDMYLFGVSVGYRF